MGHKNLAVLTGLTLTGQIGKVHGTPLFYNDNAMMKMVMIMMIIIIIHYRT